LTRRIPGPLSRCLLVLIFRLVAGSAYTAITAMSAVFVERA
jgi:hypothetical protein